MSKLVLETKTVVELRKIAKTYGVKLGAGISKEEIIARLNDALVDMPDEEELDFLHSDDTVRHGKRGRPSKKEKEEQEMAQQERQVSMEELQPADAEKPEEAPAQKPVSDAKKHTEGLVFKPAWQNPSPEPRQNGRSSWSYAKPASAGAGNPALEQQHIQTVRPASYRPRFGPGSADSGRRSPEEPRRGEYIRSIQPVVPRRSEGGFLHGTRQPIQDEGYVSRSEAPNTHIVYGSRDQNLQPVERVPRENPAMPRDTAAEPSAMPDIFQAQELKDVSGVLELHPDGYGFLRSASSCVPSPKDVYVSAAQIRRFNLRSGDLIEGRARPQRESDRYAALLYVTTVNGLPADENAERPEFEAMTACYPTRRLQLTDEADKTGITRIMDLIAPVGFGSRVLFRCPSEAGKLRLLQLLASSVSKNAKDAVTMVMLMGMRPEDVTLFRDSVPCPVYAATFDQSPENTLRQVDLLLERAERMIEMKRDVILLMDGLSQLTKLFTASAVQSGRVTASGLSAASLQKAKRLFGAARATREAGTLTIMATMDVNPGSRVDEAIAEEFSGTANTELVLDAQLSKAGVYPPIDVHRSGIRRPELLFSEEMQEGLRLLRQALQPLQPADAIRQVNDLTDRSPSAEESLRRLKAWLSLQEKQS